MSRRLICCTLLLFTAEVAGAERAEDAPSTAGWSRAVGTFLQQHCVDCHGGESAEAGLWLDELATQQLNANSLTAWVKVHDKLQAGEMPPAEMPQPEPAQSSAVLTELAARLQTVSAAQQAAEGRVALRRLNRVEYENTLRDLLSLPQLDVKDMLPADGQAHGFDKVGAALNLSYVQMARYLEAANAALEEGIVLGPRPESEKQRFPALTDGRFAQVVKQQREAVKIGEAVGLLRQPNTAQAPWTWRKFKPPVAGLYRIRMKTFGFTWDQGRVLPAERPHVVSFLAFQGSTKRPLGSFDVPPSQAEAAVIDFSAPLRPGDQLEIWFETLDDRNKPGNKELAEYTAPGVAVEWLETEGPLIEEWPPESYRHLFGDLPTAPWTAESGLQEPPVPFITVGNGKRAQRVRAKRNKITLYHVVSHDPTGDARRLLRDFAQRAFRRPVAEEELTDYLALVQEKLDQKQCFQEAMRIGYQAVLCSPEFLFLRETPGRLDDYALASRLSYFLWNSMPDEELLSLAAAGELGRPEVLRAQVERMLDDPKSQRFVEDFTGQWLDLRRITVTEPDEQLYPEYDRWLLDSMVEETHAYFREMLRRDLGADHLVDSDFAMINGRMAELYEVPGVEGVEIREVSLPQSSPRGGFLTQASVLKVTANGTSTSPVTRGAWVLDRLLGRPVPPPPPNVPAVEPDLRGTTTIRQQLAKHRESESCAVCHQRIDPPGFALESFDVIGGWRDRYRALEQGEPVDKTVKGGRPVKYKLGLPVDASGQMPGGEHFEDITGFRQILLADEEQLARSLVERLLIYATGAGIQFADRGVVKNILQRSRSQNYGLRTLIHEVVQSRTFQSK